MDREGSETSFALILVAAFAIIVALFVGGTMLMFGPMMGGGMMGGGPGWGWWGVGALIVAVLVAVAAIATAFRPSRAPSPALYPSSWPPSVTAPSTAPAPAPPATSAEEAGRIERLQEAAVVKALDEDERRLYLQVREAGGTALQRDLVASGAFSKAKVTRLLDKLERRGLVVRERYGATNRVKLTWRGPPGP